MNNNMKNNEINDSGKQDKTRSWQLLLPPQDILETNFKEAVNQAKISLSKGGIPIGSVLTEDNIVIGKGHNQRIQKDNPILHGEMDCLQNVGRKTSYKNTILYSTLMPCYMCAGAIIQFKIPIVVVGENKTFTGAKDLLEEKGVLVHVLNARECIEMMEDFIENNEVLWNEDIAE